MTGRLRRLTRHTVPAMIVLGTLLLTTDAAFAFSGSHPRRQVVVGMAAVAAFVLAAGLDRDSGAGAAGRRRRLVAGAALSALLVLSALWRATERAGPHVLLLLVPVVVAFSAAAWALLQAETQRREARLRTLRSRLDGEERERRRWVRDLHDDTLQELAAVQVLLGVAAATADPRVRAEAIADTRLAVGRQIQALRALVSRVRPLALDALGLGAALADLAHRASETSGIRVEVVEAELPRLPTETETAIYRIVQEAITNAVRHSGARRVAVAACRNGRWLEVSVRDDGPRGGADAAFTPGHGLLGMRERAEAIHAQLDIAVADPHGTLVRLRTPHPRLDGAAVAAARGGGSARL